MQYEISIRLAKSDPEVVTGIERRGGGSLCLKSNLMQLKEIEKRLGMYDEILMNDSFVSRSRESIRTITN